MTYKVNARVTSARGMAVSKYADATGTAEINVEPDDKFKSGVENGNITVSMAKLELRDRNGDALSLDKYFSIDDVKPESITLKGWNYSKNITLKAAVVSINVDFAPIPDSAPVDVTAEVLVVGRGWVGMALKELKVSFTGAKE